MKRMGPLFMFGCGWILGLAMSRGEIARQVADLAQDALRLVFG